MTQWHYHITVHSVPDILGRLPEPADDVPPMIFCDDSGACYFDNGPNPLTQAIESLLNEGGEAEWELVQIAFRPEQMICFWKQPS